MLARFYDIYHYPFLGTKHIHQRRVGKYKGPPIHAKKIRLPPTDHLKGVYPTIEVVVVDPDPA